MAFNTKIQIDDQHVVQSPNTTLTLSGDTRYAVHPNFTGDTQIIDKKYVDDNIVSGVTGGTVYSAPLLSPAAVAVGGISVGYVPLGKTSNEILQDMMFPELFGALNPINGATQSAAPSVSLTPSNASPYEVGCSISTVTINASFSRGTINPQYCSACSQRSGPVTTHYFCGPQTSGSKACTTLTPTTGATSYVITAGVNTAWGVCVATSIGTQPKSNKNNNFSSPLPANTSPAGTAAYVGAYPISATTTTISTLTKQTLVPMTSNCVQVNMVAESGGNKQTFDIACAWLGAPTNRPIIAIEQWNTVSSIWECPGGSAAASLALWTKSPATLNVQGSSVGYCQYTYNSTDRAAVCIRLKFA
jgi:hypothetical protein